MKAAVYTEFGSPDVVQVRDVQKPVPKDNEVLIQIHAASVTSTDSAGRKADSLLTRMAFGFTKPRNQILGTEFAGVIEEIGKEVTRFKVGDQIYGASGTNFAAHAEYICLPENGALAIKPEIIGFDESTAICEGFLTALPFLRDNGKIENGHDVLINGASGAVGTAALQVAGYYQAKVTGVCGTLSIDLVKSLGADDVIDYTKNDFSKTGHKYDIIFDTVGKSSYSYCKNALKDKGIYLTTVPTPAVMMQMLWTSKFDSKKAAIAFTGLRSAENKRNDLAFLSELAETGKIKAVIDRKYPLEKISDAHRYVDTGHKKGNVVVTFGHDS